MGLSVIQPSELHTFYMFGASVVFVIGMAAWWAHGANDFSASLHRHQILEATPLRATEKPVLPWLLEEGTSSRVGP